MGDRANIVLDFGPADRYAVHLGRYIFIYGHWAGEVIALRLAQALYRCRWDDPPYLARIVAQTFFDPIDLDNGEPTGFGMSPYVCDNEHALLVVDLPGNRVQEVPGNDPAGQPAREWSFDEFIADGPTGWRTYENDE
jgi:hypothetical protein